MNDGSVGCPENHFPPTPSRSRRHRWKRRCAISIATFLVWLVGQRRQQRRGHQLGSRDPTATVGVVAVSANFADPTSFDLDDEDRDLDGPVQICGISVMFGDYEKTVKEPTQPVSPSFPLFLVTDQEHLLNPPPNVTTAWTRVPVNSSLWQEDCLRPEFVGAKNNPCDRPFVFNIAKFYKMQFHRVPQMREAGCNVVVWLDATIRIHGGTFLGHMAHRASRGQNLVAYIQERHANGTLAREAIESRYGKYGGKQSPAFGPPQHVWEQYQYYLSEGYREGWFRNEPWYDEFRGVERNDGKYGVFITCMVMFDLRRSITRRFLDCWWRENVLRSTQDQMSFPYCAWKLGVPIRALPDKENSEGGATHNAYFHKMEHGM